MAEKEIYVSCDVETDGPVPWPYSMLQLGAAAFRPGGEMISTFSANLRELEGGRKHEETMRFWSENQSLYDATRENLEGPEEAMLRFDAWLAELPGSPVFVAYPAGFDFTFVYWYLINFVGASRFSHSALDIKTLAMVAMRSTYRGASKSRMPASWFSPAPHTHVAVEDAIEQGELFFNILRSLDLEPVS
ncbi:MAG: exonuclease [Cyanobacteria bacterium HKST-UBA02]|nr:exonuclease [Cyanobacteria bacterium HKST-UBA02]